MGRFGVWHRLRDFAGARGGNVAIIFAAVMIPVSGIAAAAIDFGRAGNVRSVLQMATSAAAQAGSAHLHEDRSIIEKQVGAMLAINLPPHLAGLPHRITIPTDRTSIEVTMETTVPTSLMGVLGVHELTVEATGFAKPPRPVLQPTDGIAGSGASGAEAQAAASRSLGALFGGSLPKVSGNTGFGAGTSELPALPAIRNQAQLEQLVRDLAGQLRDQQGQALPGAPGGLPPAAAVEVERLIRELGSFRR